MDVNKAIAKYLSGFNESKRSDLEQLHHAILNIQPGCRLWFLNGKNETGKVVSNPSIGYGSYTINYANGSIREFYQIGLSANSTGISIYVMGMEDKKSLATAFGKRLGKATVTGYCIKFKKLEDLDRSVLEEVIRFRLRSHQTPSVR